MRDIDDDGVGLGADELGGALEVVAFGPDRGRHPQAPLGVAGREGVPALGEDVAGGDEPGEPPGAIHEGQLLHLPLDHHPFGALDVDEPLVDGEPLARSHALGDLPASRHEAHIALGQHAPEHARVIHHGQGVNARALHHGPGLVQGGPGPDRVGIGNDAVLRALDGLDLAHLRLDVAAPEAAVDDADPALLGLHDRHGRAGHGVHVGGDDRAPEADPARQARGEVDARRVAPLEHAALGREQEIVEGAPPDKLAQALGPGHGASLP